MLVELMMLVTMDPKDSVGLVAVVSLENKDPKDSKEQVSCLVLIQPLVLA